MPAKNNTAMTRMIIDTDCGAGFPGADVDDALAIAVALLSPQVELLGITTMSANVEVAEATASVLQLLEIAGQEVPVLMGAAKPLIAGPSRSGKGSRPVRKASG